MPQVTFKIMDIPTYLTITTAWERKTDAMGLLNSYFERCKNLALIQDFEISPIPTNPTSVSVTLRYLPERGSQLNDRFARLITADQQEEEFSNQQSHPFSTLYHSIMNNFLYIHVIGDENAKLMTFYCRRLCELGRAITFYKTAILAEDNEFPPTLAKGICLLFLDSVHRKESTLQCNGSVIRDGEKIPALVIENELDITFLMQKKQIEVARVIGISTGEILHHMQNLAHHGYVFKTEHPIISEGAGGALVAFPFQSSTKKSVFAEAFQLFRQNNTAVKPKEVQLRDRSIVPSEENGLELARFCAPREQANVSAFLLNL
ncbi:MAG TPA: hypothetical protein DIC51_03935 [Coxiellaceae bacterium]|nr:hypothetical protein [Coxiellaceae bacterium]